MHMFSCSIRRSMAGIAIVAVLVSAPHAIVLAAGNSTNTAYGTNALKSNTGSFNSAFGNSALYNNTWPSLNTAVGYTALYSNSTGAVNTAIGANALTSNNGDGNTANGANALYYNTNGNFNTAVGVEVLFYNSSGTSNTALGYGALYSNDAGSYNTAVGNLALRDTTGTNNIAIGDHAGYNVVGDNNIEIGNAGGSGDNGVIRIGSDQTTTMIYGIYGASIPGGTQVYINKYGHLGTLTSSQRFKEDIKSVDSVSDKLLQLRPVSFRYKQAADDGSKPLQYGLIAEEVAKVYPELVEYDKDGKPYSVYYNLLTPLLLKELQQEHSELIAEQAQAADLKKQLSAQRAEMLAALQQQSSVMTALQNKLVQLDALIQANSSRHANEKLADASIR